MWRLTLSLLGNRTVYKGQKLFFLGTIKATVNNIYVRGDKVQCAFYSTNSKPIFRSESARYIIFIQMSKEMWDFDAEGSGDIMFSRVINGFLPDLFKRWDRMQARHLVSIILFTRVEYGAQSAAHGDLPSLAKDVRSKKTGKSFQDFYRVVAMEMDSGEWLRILTMLKTVFQEFLKDVSTIKVPDEAGSEASDIAAISHHKTILAGEPTSAMQGNILEAINMASSQFSHDYIDRDLVRTGISAVIITPGAGVYEVDYNMLKLTTDILVGNGIGIDLVCLSRMPLHSVPLFKYRTPAILSMATSIQASHTHVDADSTPRQSDTQPGGLMAQHLHGSPSRRSILGSSPQGDLGAHLRSGVSITPGTWSYALPHWIDVSFWTESTQENPLSGTHFVLNERKKKTQFRHHGNTSFVPRCRMQELQNLGVMESETSDISIPYLLEEPTEVKKGNKESKDPQKYRSISHSIKDQPTTGNRPLGISAFQDTKPLRKGNAYQGKTKHPANLQWMDEYDENVFRPPDKTQRRKFNTTPSQSPITKHFPKELEIEPQFSASPRRYGQSPITSHTRSKYETPDKSIQPMAKVVNNSRSRKESTASSTITQKPSRLSRQISLGPRGFGLAQASASTGLTIHKNIADKMAAVNRDHAFESPTSVQTSNPLSRQIQESLSREPSRSMIGLTGMPQQRQNERASKPISIRSSQGELDSMIQVNTPKVSGPSSPTTQRSSTEGMGPIQAVSVATRVKPRIALSTSGGERGIPNTLSPVSAMSPWLTLLNPSNPRKENMSIASQFRRWQHVFPRPIRTSAMKWKSLCSPAAVPLTNENFPTLHQLTTEYRESPYKISQNEDDELFEIPRSRQALVRELIAFRLSHGFQLVVGSYASSAAGRPPSENVNVFDEDFMTADGSTVFMSLGNTIHQLVCAADGEVEVKRFQRKPTTAVAPSLQSLQGWSYKPLIRTMLGEEYESRQLSLDRPEPELNWNYVDNFLAGYHEEFSDVLRFWRARFVLIPVEIPSRRPLVSEDNDEEIRLEGIRKLTQMWQKHRFVSLEERHYQTPLQPTKDTNPLAIEYQTHNPSAVVAAGVDNAVLIEPDGAEAKTQLFSEQDLYHQSNVDLQKLAKDIQGEHGIRVMDRRWHLRLYSNCFVGVDLVSWLLKYFKDVQTRDEAVELGNNIMRRGLFEHVQHKHDFRDGNFFFQIASNYRRKESRASWFGGRRTVPSTPSVESSKGSPFSDIRLKTPSDDSALSSGSKTPTSGSGAKPTVALSRVLRFDVDHRKRSYRPEIINLHYDRLHNPDNCYHIRIDWMNVTAKLIEDTIVTWATTAERYGLRLVELPIAEACHISQTHPFRSVYIVSLAVQPPEAPPLQYIDSTSFTPHGKPEKFVYHKALLSHLGFVLDMESKDSFPSDVNVTYSWGKPDYQLTQYVHKSGLVLAQITEDGKFLLLGNRLYNNRAATTKESSKYDRPDNADRRPATAVQNLDRGSPFSSPLVRAISDHASPALASKPSAKLTLQLAESIKDEVESFCQNSPKLRAFYSEVFKSHNPPSPGITAALEAPIPSLGLPPSVVVVKDTIAPSQSEADTSMNASHDGLNTKDF